MVFAFKTIRSVALAFAHLDKKAMFLLYQAVDESTFDKIAKAKWSREAWKSRTFFKGVDYVKEFIYKLSELRSKLLTWKKARKFSLFFTITSNC